MAIPALSLAVVGADFANKSGPGRRFEIALCRPGDRVSLVHEPKNRADENAIMVMSERDVQMGYIPSQRAPYILGLIRAGHEVRSVFQGKSAFGAWIRVAFDGDDPVLPVATMDREGSHADPDTGFYPDFIPPDD